MAWSLVLDTNVLLSGLAYPSSVPGKIVTAWRTGAVKVVLSPYILDELRRVLPRLRERHQMTDMQISELVDCLSFEVDLVEPDSTVDVALTDPFDQKILGTLRVAQSTRQTQFLITGDKALLKLANRYPILSPAEFWQRFGG